MDYLVFDTEENAIAVERKIYQTGAALAAERGYKVDAKGILGFVDGKPAPDDHTRTVRWYKPRQRMDGKWVVRHPKHSQILQSEPALAERLAFALDGLKVEAMADDWFRREGEV